MFKEKENRKLKKYPKKNNEIYNSYNSINI